VVPLVQFGSFFLFSVLLQSYPDDDDDESKRDRSVLVINNM